MPRQRKPTPEEELQAMEDNPEIIVEKAKNKPEAKSPDELTLEDLPGIGPKGAQKLREAGYNDLISIAAASSGEIAAACEIGDQTAEKIIQSARSALDMGFKTASDLLERRKEVGK